MLPNNDFEIFEDDVAVDTETEFYNVPDKRITDMLAEACLETE